MTVRIVLVSFAAGPLLCACVSVAPPIRVGHYGAPGRMEAGMVEAGGTATWSDIDISGGPMIGYGVTDGVTVEGGAEIGSSNRAIGYAGIRYTPLRPEGRSRAFVLDLESGGGAGVGGQRCVDDVCEADRLDWQRIAGGGYVGIGIGGKFKWFSPWLRIRTQASLAENIPITSLTSGVIGVQFTIASFAHIYLGTGVGYLANTNISGWGLAYLDGGLSFTIPTPRTRRMREARVDRSG